MKQKEGGWATSENMQVEVQSGKKLEIVEKSVREGQGTLWNSNTYVIGIPEADEKGWEQKQYLKIY